MPEAAGVQRRWRREKFHAIIILNYLEIKLVAPLEWHWQDNDGTLIKWDMSCPADGAVHLSLLEELIAGRIWVKGCPHESNGGLDRGEPDLKVHKQIISRLIASGRQGGGIQSHGKHRLPQRLDR